MWVYQGIRTAILPAIVLLAVAACPLSALANEAAVGPDVAASESPPPKPKLDRSGKKQVGKASIYSSRFNNKKMADGNLMDPHDDNAASKTLPLGTRAKVTNLKNGKSTEVTIQDRGPHVKGRIIDLPPGKAKEIGLTKQKGVAKVAVEPMEVPLPDGGVKLGDAAKSEVN